MVKIEILVLKVMITILMVALIGSVDGQPIVGSIGAQPIRGGVHVGNTQVRCFETVQDLKDTIHGCVLQLINPFHPLQCFVQDCCHVLTHNIICACQARLELEPLLDGVIPLFQKCRVDCDRLTLKKIMGICE